MTGRSHEIIRPIAKVCEQMYAVFLSVVQSTFVISRFNIRRPRVSGMSDMVLVI